MNRIDVFAVFRVAFDYEGCPTFELVGLAHTTDTAIALATRDAIKINQSFSVMTRSRAAYENDCEIRRAGNTGEYLVEAMTVE